MSEHEPPTESEVGELLRAIQVGAPAHVHERVQALVAERTRPRGRTRSARRWAVTALPAACALALALAVALSGGGGTRLTVSQTVALTLRGATMPAPAQSASDHAELAAHVGGVAFPYWEDSFGWRATGAREDRVDGRRVMTVFYAHGRRQWIGYAIVGGAPAPGAHGGTVIRRDGVTYRLASERGARVLTWVRDGRLCVVSSRGVPDRVLLALASWNERTATAS